MEKRYFYSNHINETSLILDHEESRHCTKVLRLTVHDPLTVLDGQGNVYECIVHEVGKFVKAGIQVKKKHPKKNHFHLAIAPTKKADRMEWMVEKLTEIGIDHITFLNTDHSEKHRLKAERLQSKIKSAAKQSGQFWFPTFKLDVPFQQWLTDLGNNPMAYIAHCSENFPKQKIQKLDENVSIAIGPEGDFSDAEIEWAMKSGIQSIDLGESRLRTETAGLLAGVLAKFK